MSKSKDKGDRFEAALVKYARGHGHPRAVRTLAGEREDRSDIANIGNCAIQAKDWREYELALWMRQVKRQAENAGLPRYAVVFHPRGVPVDDAGEQWALIPYWLLCELLMEAS